MRKIISKLFKFDEEIEYQMERNALLAKRIDEESELFSFTKFVKASSNYERIFKKEPKHLYADEKIIRQILNKKEFVNHIKLNPKTKQLKFMGLFVKVITNGVGWFVK